MLNVLLLAACCAQVDLTPEDLTALFVENALRAQTLRVTWTVTSTAAPAKAELSKSFLRAADSQKQADIPEDIRAKVAEAVTGHKTTLEAIKMHSQLTSRQDYWSDRAHFQMRSPMDRKQGGPFSSGAPPRISFPDVEATRDQLVSVFADINVMSCGPATEGRIRVWEAKTLGDGHHSGLVMLRNSDPYRFFPPLSLPKPEWGGIANPIDELFVKFLQKGKAKILGEFDLDGVKTLLIDVHVHVEPVPGRQYPEIAVRAFLDVAHAGMPRRIEFFLGAIEQYRNHIGLCIDHPKLTSQRIVKDIVFQEFQEGDVKVIYPVSGIEQQLSRAPSPDYAVSRAQPMLAVHQELVWKVEKVRINPPMSRENFAMTFPPNTVFLNQPTNELLLTGDVEGYVERVVQRATAQTSGTFWSSRDLIMFGALVILGIVAVIFFRSRRKVG